MPKLLLQQSGRAAGFLLSTAVTKSTANGRVFVTDFVYPAAVRAFEETAFRVSFLIFYGYWFSNSGAFLGLQKNPGSASEFAAKRPCLQHGLCLFDIRFNITAKWPCLLRGLCLFSSSLHVQRLSTDEFPSNSKPRLQRFQQYILDSVTIAKWPCHGPCLFDRSSHIQACQAKQFQPTSLGTIQSFASDYFEILQQILAMFVGCLPRIETELYFIT